MSLPEMTPLERTTNARIMDAIEVATGIVVPIEHVQLVLETVRFLNIMDHTEEHLREVNML